MGIPTVNLDVFKDVSVEPTTEVPVDPITEAPEEPQTESKIFKNLFRHTYIISRGVPIRKGYFNCENRVNEFLTFKKIIICHKFIQKYVLI